MSKLKKLLFILLLCNWHSIFCQYYTGSNTPFGQNRVQYNNFFWQSYDFQRFKIHFTKGGQKHAVYTAKTAHLYLKKLEKWTSPAMSVSENSIRRVEVCSYGITIEVTKHSPLATQGFGFLTNDS